MVLAFRLYCDNSSFVDVRRCTFSYNTAFDDGGGVANYRGAYFEDAFNLMETKGDVDILPPLPVPRE